MSQYLWLMPLGFAVGGLGTLIGIGGGFILVPVLLLLYPSERPETIASISLAVVFLNALSGSWAYGRMARIDYRSGLLFASATVPGAIAGALTTQYLPHRAFDGILGAVLVAAAAYLVLHRRDRLAAPPSHHAEGLTIRRLVEKDGTVHTYAFRPKLGIGLSLFVGYASSVLGIGGGIIHVPALVRLLNFPVHVATATSHFMLAIMAFTGTVVHISAGSFSPAASWQTASLGLGVVVGAQVGAALSKRMRGVWIIRCLAIALGAVGLRILALAWGV